MNDKDKQHVYNDISISVWEFYKNIRLCKNYTKVTRRSVLRSMQGGMQYAVGTQYIVGAKKVNSHSVLSKYGWWGLLPLVQKGQTHTVGYAVCSTQ